jgi:hypothetical protein
MEHDLATSMAKGMDTDERLARAAERISEAEATYRRLAEPRFRE